MTRRKQKPGETVRGLMRRAGQAALSTALARDASAWPYGSLVLVAADHDASPLLLLSDLADHSRNIAADARVTLLFDGTAGWRNPLAGPRASVLGRARPDPAPGRLGRFLARHPEAESYAGFKDFKLYRVTVERAHLVAGFGRIDWLAAGEILFDAAAAGPLAEAEAEILAHMNRDHGAALGLIARRILGQDGAGQDGAGQDGGGQDGGDWVLSGVDPEGCDLRCGAARARAAFDKTVSDAEQARVELVRLAKLARRRTAGKTP